jgi:hypothetical protein
MKTATTIAQMLVRVTGVIQIVLGLLIWTGNALNLVNLHTLSGLLFVLGLWALGIIAASAGPGARWAAVALVWGLIVLVLGVTQKGLLPGPSHWVVQVVHFLIGLGAIVQAEWLGRSIKASLAGRPPISGPLRGEAG